MQYLFGGKKTLFSVIYCNAFLKNLRLLITIRSKKWLNFTQILNVYESWYFVSLYFDKFYPFWPVF